jgi:putative DNA primase/helicase
MSTEERAREFVVGLLNGANGTAPDSEDFGDWQDDIELLYSRRDEEEKLHKMFDTLLKVDPGWKKLMDGPQRSVWDIDIPDDADDQAILDAGQTHPGNAEALHILFGDLFVYTDSHGWLYYTGTHWERKGGEEALRRHTVATLKHRRMLAVTYDYTGEDNPYEYVIKDSKPTAYNVSRTMELFKALVHTDISTFDASKDKLNVANGVLDLKTGDLSPHSPDQRFTYCLSTAYNPNADYSEWENLVRAWIDGPEVAEYLKRAVGYSLTGRTREEVMFYLYGPARGGKGTFTETILELLDGRPLATEVGFDVFARQYTSAGEKFVVAGLKACRFVAAGESGESQYLAEELIKRLTGGNWITAQHKYKDPFTFRPQFKLWLATNPQPMADPNDTALWARLHVVRFPHSWLGKEDKLLKGRLRTQSSLEGVLAWAIEGAKKWYEVGLNPPDQVARETQVVRDELDYVKQWVEDEVIITDDPKDRVSNQAIHIRYENWCANVGVKPLGMRRLGKNLSRLGIQSYRTGGERGRQGITLQSKVEAS